MRRPISTILWVAALAWIATHLSETGSAVINIINVFTITI